jgi:hypothetical protein
LAAARSILSFVRPALSSAVATEAS